jgi:hypothetical protein
MKQRRGGDQLVAPRSSGYRADSSGCRAYRGVSGTKTALRTGLVNSLARQSM